MRSSRRGEIIDFTELHKRGLLEDKEEKGKDVIDFTSSSVGQSSSFDFLDSLANAGKTSPANQVSDGQLNELKIKLEDTTYKLENLIDKVRALEMKLQELGR